MTIDQFLIQCEIVWPTRELSSALRLIYVGKLKRFGGRELAKIFNHLTETSKYFPKIADVFAAAREMGEGGRVRDFKPHNWSPTDCRLCGGSGQLAVFFEQLFDPANHKRELRLQRAMQWESSNPTARTKDFTRFYFRCSCPAGDVATLDKGLPRWSTDRPEVLELSS